MADESTLSTPAVVVNYKVYRNAIGDEALRLTKVLEGAAASFPDVAVAVCPSHPDVARVAGATDLAVLGQGVSGDEPGSGTGRVLPEALSDAGAIGSLVNHAENQVPPDAAKLAVERLRGLGMVSILCTADEDTTRTLAAARPTMLAVEPPQLIGGDISVTTADPGIVTRSVEAARSVDGNAVVLCGAGVKSGADVTSALQLGTAGVLVASGIVKASDPGEALAGLLEGASGDRTG